MTRTRPMQPLVAGNWKMNPTARSDALMLARAAAATAARHQAVTTVICPPTVFLAEVAAEVGPSRLAVGAQTMAAEERGAFTGETSPLMLAGLAGFVIVGHSERRANDGETDEGVAAKVASAVAHGIRPIAAIGERIEERRAGRTEEVVDRQLHAAVSRLEAIHGSGLVIAYEPVWAIGSGEAASPADAQVVAARIRELLGTVDADAAPQVPILYGGSVTGDNARAFFDCPDIDGALVGGGSLDAASFEAIVAAAEAAAAHRRTPSAEATRS